jgi:hypothetical protein
MWAVKLMIMPVQIVYYDGQFDDSRLNVSLACTAALAGAAVLNYAEVTQLLKVPAMEALVSGPMQLLAAAVDFRRIVPRKGSCHCKKPGTYMVPHS